MKNSKRIKGVDILLERLPEKYHSWSKFDYILELHFEKAFDYEKYFEIISCIRLVLTDRDGLYKIRMTLKNAYGDVGFNVFDSCFGGLAIKDISESCWDNRLHFVIKGFENDSFEVYCDEIEVELIEVAET